MPNNVSNNSEPSEGVFGQTCSQPDASHRVKDDNATRNVLVEVEDKNERRFPDAQYEYNYSDEDDTRDVSVGKDRFWEEAGTVEKTSVPVTVDVHELSFGRFSGMSEGVEKIHIIPGDAVRSTGTQRMNELIREGERDVISTESTKKPLSKIQLKIIVAVVVAALAVAYFAISQNREKEEPPIPEPTITETWFGSIEETDGKMLLKDISGIEGYYIDERGSAAENHGYYALFKLEDATINSDGLSGKCTMRLRWQPRITRPIQGDVFEVEGNMLVSFDSADPEILYCKIGKEGDSFWCTAKLSKSKLVWTEGYMIPGYLDDPTYREKLKHTLKR